MKNPISLDAKKFNRTFKKGLLARLDFLLQYEELELRLFEKNLSRSRHLNKTTYVKLRNKRLQRLKAIELLIEAYSEPKKSVSVKKGGKDA
jgi:hypothetical protein